LIIFNESEAVEDRRAHSPADAPSPFFTTEPGDIRTGVSTVDRLEAHNAAEIPDEKENLAKSGSSMSSPE
jgi:hypothetical protein